MLTTPRFRIYREAGDLDVTILPGDRMRAERASTTELHPSQRGPGAAKVHAETWLLLWLWCSATRLGLTTDKFTPWADTVLDYDRIDAQGNVVTRPTDATDDAEDDDAVDPTQRGASTT